MYCFRYKEIYDPQLSLPTQTVIYLDVSFKFHSTLMSNPPNFQGRIIYYNRNSRAAIWNNFYLLIIFLLENNGKMPTFGPDQRNCQNDRTHTHKESNPKALPAEMRLRKITKAPHPPILVAHKKSSGTSHPDSRRQVRIYAPSRHNEVVRAALPRSRLKFSAPEARRLNIAASAENATAAASWKFQAR